MNKQNSDNTKNLIKYLIIGLIVSLAVRYIPDKILSNNEIITIGAIASVTYGILDMYAPSIFINNT